MFKICLWIKIIKIKYRTRYKSPVRTAIVPDDLFGICDFWFVPSVYFRHIRLTNISKTLGVLCPVPLQSPNGCPIVQLIILLLLLMFCYDFMLPLFYK